MDERRSIAENSKGALTWCGVVGSAVPQCRCGDLESIDVQEPSLDSARCKPNQKKHNDKHIVTVDIPNMSIKEWSTLIWACVY